MTEIAKPAFAGCVLAVLGTAPAQAAMINLDNSAADFGTIPDGADNDFLNTFAGGDELEGYYGSQVSLSGAKDVRFEFFGWEAGFENEFRLDRDSDPDFETRVFGTDNGAGSDSTTSEKWGTYPGSPLAETTESLHKGEIPFQFLADGGADSVDNGDNPSDFEEGSPGEVNFFASFDDSGLDTDLDETHPNSGRSLLLFLDDAGAGNDDNHDDMVVRVQTVPTPGMLALVGAGLLGLGATVRRRAHG